jgi:predicted O-methyltransferase YrrM
VTLRERLRLIFDAIRGRKPPPVIVYRDSPPEIRAAHPGGHFYSPIVDPADATANEARIWPEPPTDVAGIDFDDASHRHVLETLFACFYKDFDYAEAGAPDEELKAYYIGNSQFGWLDARALFVLLREWRPSRIIEVGSGYSTLLMADVARRFLGGATKITAIEPYPRPFLARIGVELIEAKVQDVPLTTFDALDRGDVLFIDSSHVSKTGSDVNRLFFEILPRLKAGVRIHVHDVFLPADYPKEWVVGDNRSWNEQYVLRALLMDSTRYRVVFGSAHAYYRHRDAVTRALGLAPGVAYGGGSFWFEVVD